MNREVRSREGSRDLRGQQAGVCNVLRRGLVIWNEQANTYDLYGEGSLTFGKYLGSDGCKKGSQDLLVLEVYGLGKSSSFKFQVTKGEVHML